MTGKTEKQLISCLLFILCLTAFGEPPFSRPEDFSFLINPEQGQNPLNNLTDYEFSRFQEFFNLQRNANQNFLNNPTITPEQQAQALRDMFEESLRQAKNQKGPKGAGGAGTPPSGGSDNPGGLPLGSGLASAIGGISAAAVPAFQAMAKTQQAAIKANGQKAINDSRAKTAENQAAAQVSMNNETIQGQLAIQKNQFDKKLEGNKLDSAALADAMSKMTQIKSMAQANERRSKQIDFNYQAALWGLQMQMSNNQTQLYQFILSQGRQSTPGRGNGLVVTGAGGNENLGFGNPLFRSNLTYSPNNRFVLGSMRGDKVKAITNRPVPVVAARTNNSGRNIASVFHAKQNVAPKGGGNLLNQVHKRP